MGPGLLPRSLDLGWLQEQGIRSPCKMEWLGSPVPLLMMVWREARICGLRVLAWTRRWGAYRSEDVYGCVHTRCHVNRNSVRGV